MFNVLRKISLKNSDYSNKRKIINMAVVKKVVRLIILYRSEVWTLSKNKVLNKSSGYEIS